MTSSKIYGYLHIGQLPFNIYFNFLFCIWEWVQISTHGCKCPQRPDEGVRCPETRVSDNCQLPALGARNQSRALTAESSFQCWAFFHLEVTHLADLYAVQLYSEWMLGSLPELCSRIFLFIFTDFSIQVITTIIHSHRNANFEFCEILEIIKSRNSFLHSFLYLVFISMPIVLNLFLWNMYSLISDFDKMLKIYSF